LRRSAGPLDLRAVRQFAGASIAVRAKRSMSRQLADGVEASSAKPSGSMTAWQE
jgi:hypothetical protein